MRTRCNVDHKQNKTVNRISPFAKENNHFRICSKSKFLRKRQLSRTIRQSILIDWRLQDVRPRQEKKVLALQLYWFAAKIRLNFTAENIV